MSGEEIVGQLREIAGEQFAECDLCGDVFPVDALREIDGLSPQGEHDHIPRICDGCWERIHSGEIDVETLLLDEDERRERGS